MTEREVILIVLGSIGAAGVAAVLAVLVAQIRIRGPEDSFFVGCFRVINQFYTRLFHRLRVEPPGDALENHGPVILIANHRGGADPMLVAGCTRRWVRFLMAREYQEQLGLHWLFQRLGTIPVNRDGNDLSAMRRAMKELQAGHAIGIFPQGGIRADEDELGDAKGGVALLALRTGATVVPAWLDGAPAHDSVFVGVFTPSRTTLWVGEPIRCEESSGRPTREDLEAFTGRLLTSLHALRDRAKAQHPAGAPDETAHAEPTA